ncbi:tyrosine-protein phosphatase [Kribbella sp. NPDC051586]|uniref:tyrosine-protein phosphatase n=1 Tax=Kribbella sp. NPDC051586 TaxID=3364118 RepID=UPI00378EF664
MQPLTWPDCRNVRDLGGLPATGGELRTGRLIRSDNLDQLAAAGLAAVHAARISRFVDLRSAWECGKYRSPYADDPRLVNVPLWDPGDPDVPEELGLFEQYRVLVDDYAERVAAAIVAIAEAPAGCVVVSCHAGKDRTGVVVALTLDLVGVPGELVAADYEASGASADVMVRLLDHVRTQHGGTSAYLRNSGATTDQLDGLIGRLTG